MSVWAVLLGAGSASAQPEETEGTCSSYALSPSEATLSSDGGSGTLDLTWDWEAPEVEEFCIANCTNASCGEQTGSVRSSATWLTATKNGDDQVDYTVAGGYTGSSSREATLTVAGATFTVTQQPPGPCPSSPDRLSSTSLSFPAATSVRYVSVAGRSDCSWSVSGDQDWLTTPSSVSGGGLVRVQADENPGGAREGTVAIGGSSVSVSQASGCPASPTTVSPSSLTFPAAGGTQSLSVTGPARCSWSVSDDRTWITATPPSVSTGGEVTVTVPLGHGGESGTVTIGNQAIPVSVTRTACPRTPGVTPSSLTFPWPGGTQSLSVAGPAHCSWSVSDDRAWITATPSTVPAGGTVQVRVTPGPPGRSGTVSIGRATVPVTVEPCPTSPTRVSSTSVSFPATGGRESVTVSGPSGCRWVVSSAPNWIGATPGSVSDGDAVTIVVGSGYAGESGTVTVGVERIISVTVEPPPNRAPIAEDDTATTPHNTSVTVRVLDNDSDPDPGDAIRVSRLVTGPTNGTAVIDSGNRTITYTPSDGFTGDATFDYRIADRAGLTAQARVTVTVGPPPNRAPIARDDTATTPQDTAVTVSVLDNDRDPDPGDAIRVSRLVTNPAAGTAVIDSGNRTITYTPSDGFTGDATFDYRIADRAGLTAQARVTVTVGPPPNRAPIARDDTATTPQDTAVTVSVLDNDRDPDPGDAIRVSRLVTNPAAGTAVIDSGNRTITYTPSDGFTGDATFDYRIADRAGLTAQARVTVTVDPPPNRAPIARDDTATTPQDTAVTVSVLDNDRDPDPGDAIRVSRLVTNPAAGTAVIDSGNRTITYTPSDGFTGDATFDYLIADRAGLTAQARVTVTVGPPPNRAPTARDDTATTTRNYPLTVRVLDNDSDPDGDSLAVDRVVARPANGTATVSSDRLGIDYAPSSGWTGMDTLTYRVTDGAGGTADASVMVTVTINRPPVADAGSDQRVLQGSTVTLDGTGSSDPDGHRLYYSWRQERGPAVVLTDPTSATPAFPAPIDPGNLRLVFRLVVSDLRGLEVSEDEVAITAINGALVNRRDLLLRDYAGRKNYGNNACRAWDSLHSSAHEVFVWNTHRLHRSAMLHQVTELHAVYGRDGTSCGGGEHNRTYMAMTQDLRAAFNRIHAGTDMEYPAWEITGDLACSTGGNCPHWPFTRQIETHGGHPRAQINYFESYPGVGPSPPERGPQHDRITIRSDLIFEMDQDYNRPFFEFHASAPSCTGLGSHGRPMTELYIYGYGDPDWDWEPSDCSPSCVTGVDVRDEVVIPAGGGVFSATVTAPASCGWTAHSTVTWVTVGVGSEPGSAAVSSTGQRQARFQVAENTGYGRRGAVRVAGKQVVVRQAGDSFRDHPVEVGSGVRAVHILELRTRVDALRQREGLTPFTWTDAEIMAEVTAIAAAHVTEMRGALQAAYEAAGRTAPVYTDPGLSPRAAGIRAVHMTELRSAVVALEQPVP